MNINETSQQIYKNNVEKGFWDKQRNVGEMLMLVTSELAEALESDRKNKHANIEEFELSKKSYDNNDKIFSKLFEMHIKDSFEDEIADAVIRLFDMAAGLKIDLQYHINQKMKYNSTREHMHGKKY